ncbi:MAG: hypothetical protein SGPRY_009418 [Prymnesium sp.]
MRRGIPPVGPGHCSHAALLPPAATASNSSDEDEGSEEGRPAAWHDAWREEAVSGDEELSGKMLVLFALLQRSAGERTLVFSQSLHLVDILQELLESKPRPADDGLSWKRNRDFLRLDGSTPQAHRQRMVEKFQDRRNDVQLMLISTRAGNLGINLTAATRVVLFDSSWNPSNDAQAIFRAWRFGQTKPVFVYRLLGAGTVEEKVSSRSRDPDPGPSACRNPNP